MSKKINYQQIYDLYHSGQTKKQIAEFLKISDQTVLKGLRLFKLIHPRRKNGVDLELIKDLWHKGFNNKQIGKKINRSEGTIKKCLKSLGLRRLGTINIIDFNLNLAKCSKCEEIFPIERFPISKYKTKTGIPTRHTYCQTCKRLQQKANVNSSIEKFLQGVFTRLKRLSKKRNLPFNIDCNYLIQLFYRQNGKCFYTQEKMKWGEYDEDLRARLSIDKIIPENGYVKGNIVMCRYKINCCKSDLSLDEIREWMPKWYEKIMKKISKSM